MTSETGTEETTIVALFTKKTLDPKDRQRTSDKMQKISNAPRS